jgi:hypothetical protein
VPHDVTGHSEGFAARFLGRLSLGIRPACNGRQWPLLLEQFDCVLDLFCFEADWQMRMREGIPDKTDVIEVML